MREGWVTRPLKEIVAAMESVNPAHSPDDEFDYIDVSSVSNKTFTIEATQRLKGMDAPSRARRLVRANDVLFATVRPTLQRIAIVPQELNGEVCSTGYAVLRSLGEVDHSFLFYWLFSESFSASMERLQKGASYPAVTNAEVLGQLIPYPSLAGQSRIIAILDEAFEAISTAKANTEKSLQNAREVFESQLDTLFEKGGKNWLQKRLGDLCEIARGGSPRPIQAFLTDDDDGVNWIKIGDASASRKYIYETAQKIKPEGIARSRLVHDGDFLLSNSMSFGRPYIMRISGCIHDGWLVLSNYQDVFDQDFLYHLLGSRQVFNQFDRLAAGSTVRNLNIGLVSGVVVSVPSLDEQRRMALSLGRVSDLVADLDRIHQSKLSVLDELKQSLLHQAFTGALTAKTADRQLAEAV